MSIKSESNFTRLEQLQHKVTKAKAELRFYEKLVTEEIILIHSPDRVKERFEKGASVAFRVKGEDEWVYTDKPIWDWGACDYKIIDIEKDDYYW